MNPRQRTSSEPREQDADTQSARGSTNPPQPGPRQPGPRQPGPRQPGPREDREPRHRWADPAGNRNGQNERHDPGWRGRIRDFGSRLFSTDPVQFNIRFFVVALLGLLALQFLLAQFEKTTEIPYSEFEAHLEAGRIASVVVSNQRVRGEFREPVDGHEFFVAQRVEPALVDRLREYDVRYDGVIENPFIERVLGWVIPIGLILLLWFWLSRRMMRQGGISGGLMQIGKSNARVYFEERTDTRFRDVAGIDEVREELEEVVAFLRDPEGHGRLGAHVPKGVLLAGPPGTGKTLLARAMAGEAEVPFFYINGSEFVEMFVGVGASRTRDLFRQARERAPAIVFIDELDALGQRHGGGATTGGGHDEKEQTLNQLLVEMDGFDPTEGLMIICATNRPDVLDPALLRAGRFDRRVIIDRPDKKGRREILEVHTRRIVMGSDVDLDEVAQLTAGFTGADLENLVNEAALLATRRGADAVMHEHFTGGLERVVAGLRKKHQVLSEAERERVAYHELGHAVLTFLIPDADPVQKVSIIPRSVGALGYTLQRPIGDRYLMTRDALINQMCVLLGGRAAEGIFFDEVSTGAQNDLQKVTEIARAMVTQYGMSETLGLLSYESPPQSPTGMPLAGATGRPYADATAREIDAASRALVEDAYTRTCRLLEQHQEHLAQAATALLERETMGEPELRGFFPDATPDLDAGQSRDRTTADTDRNQ